MAATNKVRHLRLNSIYKAVTKTWLSSTQGLRVKQETKQGSVVANEHKLRHKENRQAPTTHRLRQLKTENNMAMIYMFSG